MPGFKSLGLRVSPSVSGAVPTVSASVSHAASRLCCAVHCGAALRLALKIASGNVRIVSPTGAVSMTRGGVTAITFDGGASKSDATLQLVRSARAAKEARPARVVTIVTGHECTFCTERCTANVSDFVE